MPDPLPRAPSLEETGHHEAAHAVAAILRPGVRPLAYVYLRENSRGWYGENVMDVEEETVWERLVEVLRPDERDAEAVMLAAGRCGHERFVGSDLDPAASDLWASLDDNALRILSGWPTIEATNRYADDEEYEASFAVGRQWLHEIREEAGWLVHREWGAVVRVAAGLLSAPEHRLSADEVRAIVLERA